MVWVVLDEGEVVDRGEQRGRGSVGCGSWIGQRRHKRQSEGARALFCFLLRATKTTTVHGRTRISSTVSCSSARRLSRADLRTTRRSSSLSLSLLPAKKLWCLFCFVESGGKRARERGKRRERGGDGGATAKNNNHRESLDTPSERPIERGNVATS